MLRDGVGLRRGVETQYMIVDAPQRAECREWSVTVGQTQLGYFGQ
jgi:hypothetical protein